MRYVRDIQKLRRDTFLGEAALLLVFCFGVISIILFFDPGLIGTPQEQQEYYRGQWIWLLTGICFLIFAIFCSIFAARRSRHVIWILNNVRPELMRLTIEIEHWSDSTDYTAVLSAGGGEGNPLWKVGLYSPSWKVEALANKQLPAQVYFDPKTKKPAVIETEFGLLWAGAASHKSFEPSAS